MNSSAYIFGSFGNGYTQYPDDYSQTIFQKFNEHSSSAQTQIAIHRDNNLMYFGYLRKLQGEQYIGFCILLNDVMISDLKGMFFLFENTIMSLVINGEILQFSDKGEIISKVDRFYRKQEFVEQAVECLKVGFDKLEGNQCKLPTLNYGISKDEVKYFDVAESEEEIFKAAYTYGYTYIYKDKSFNTQSLNSYKGVVTRLNREKQEIVKQLNSLLEEHKKVLRQKKQVQYVIILLFTVLACALGLFFLNDSLNVTRNELTDANNSIVKKNGEIENKSEQISALKSTVQNLKSSLEAEISRREKAERDLDDYKSSISSFFPIFITDVEIGNADGDSNLETYYGNTIYSSNSMYLKPRIAYKGIRSDETITLYVKLYTPSGLSTNNSSPLGYSFSESIAVSDGSDNIFVMKGWGGADRGHWNRGSYRFEIWYDNICLRSKGFFIH